MSRFGLLAFAIALGGMAGCKANPPGRSETGTMTFAKRHFFVGNKNQKKARCTLSRLVETTQTQVRFYRLRLSAATASC
jgi:hypothetical protein